MSTGADSDDQSTSSGGRPRSDLEKDDLAGSDDDNRSAFQHHHGGDGGNDALPEIKRRRLESEGVVVDGGAVPSPTLSSECGSGGTISVIDADAGAAPRSALEKDDLAGSDDDNRSAFQHHHGGGGGNDALPEIKRRRLESEGVVVDEGALPSPTPSSECGSGGTIGNIDADAGAASLAQKLFACPICGREFGSKRAVSGHMRVHDARRREQWRKEGKPAISAVTGKFGSVGCRSVSPKSKGVADSMAVVIPESVIDPMPTASASGSSSAEPNPPNDDSMAIVVASSDNPTSQVVVHPPCSPQFLQGHQPAAPQAVVAQAQPSVAQGPQLAEAVSAQFVVHQPAAPQVVVAQAQPSVAQGPQLAEEASAAQFGVHQPAAPQVVHRASPTPPARDEQGWLRCREKGCDHRRFATHEGLRSHMACHKIRQQNKEAAAAASIPKKHGGRPKVSAHELTAALAPSPPAAMEEAPAQPAVAPGVLRLFGVNIVPAVPPASAAQEVSAAVTETGESSASSTDKHEQ
ncbi:hypothetical protein QYE76_014239 [Lolium multiflorum]|uniref:C2H2-type domain-containing protein n=1 Tax=Lolium multiflorum TaxID=4521 RepID=A0AAD8U4F6_LOLMU|nr:hypothetical protein QYE76_014239 [Lolium multiflorum]